MAENRSPLLITTIENGLTVIGEPRETNQSVSLGFFVKTGARDEVGRESGVSHFLEHMMFKGTKSRSALDITYELGNLGAQANAYTSEEATVFYSTVVPEYFSPMQELLSDMLRPLLDEEEFNTEKKVILEEIALYQDKPQFCLFEKALRAYFEEHPAGNSVLGSTDSIREVTRDEMARYFERRYSPANMALIATGKFNYDDLVASAQTLCASWKPFETGRKATPFKKEKSDTLSFRKKGLNTSHVVLLCGGPSAQDPLRYPLTVLSTILGDGSGSKLYWRLVETGLAEAAVMDSDERDNTGCTLVYLATEGAKLQEVKEIAHSVLSEPLAFSAEELEMAKRKLATRIVLSGELPIGRLMAIGNDWMYRGEVQELKNIVDAILAVSKKDIEHALSKFPLQKWSEYQMLPE